jgi:hypothetical protein
MSAQNFQIGYLKWNDIWTGYCINRTAVNESSYSQIDISRIIPVTDSYYCGGSYYD